MVLKHSKRSEISVGEEEGDIRREAAVTGEKLESGRMHINDNGRKKAGVEHMHCGKKFVL